ncbi:MAG TPA: hypothetical protein VGK19_18085 [Capsulimonadaceae bacterium]|jgi:hypothetical protein
MATLWRATFDPNAPSGSNLDICLLWDNSPDNDWIAQHIHMQGCRVADALYGADSEKGFAVKAAVTELTDKLINLAAQKDRVHRTMRETCEELQTLSLQGIKSRDSGALRHDLEHFHVDSTSSLDTCARRFLGETIGFHRKKHGQRDGRSFGEGIVKAFEEAESIDREVIDAIGRDLKWDEDHWLKPLINDRNVLHERSPSITPFTIVNGQPLVLFTRANGDTFSNDRILEYVDVHYGNVTRLVRDLIRYVLWARFPLFKGLELKVDGGWGPCDD